MNKVNILEENLFAIIQSCKDWTQTGSVLLNPHETLHRLTANVYTSNFNFTFNSFDKTPSQTVSSIQLSVAWPVHCMSDLLKSSGQVSYFKFEINCVRLTQNSNCRGVDFTFATNPFL